MVPNQLGNRCALSCDRLQVDLKDSGATEHLSRCLDFAEQTLEQETCSEAVAASKDDHAEWFSSLPGRCGHKEALHLASTQRFTVEYVVSGVEFCGCF